MGEDSHATAQEDSVGGGTHTTVGRGRCEGEDSHCGEDEGVWGEDTHLCGRGRVGRSHTGRRLTVRGRGLTPLWGEGQVWGGRALPLWGGTV